MIVDSLVSAAGGYEKVAGYSRYLSEGGRLTMIAGMVGIVANPIFGNSLGFAAGATVLGYATFGLFNELSKDFHVVDVIIKRHHEMHQAWLESRGQIK